MSMVRKGTRFNDIVSYTDNVIMRKIQTGTENRRCYIVGDGYSASATQEGIVTEHDPWMPQFAVDVDLRHTVFLFHYTWNCVGLDEAAKEIAAFADECAKSYDEVVFVGHSKCGLCLTAAAGYCESLPILVTISAPFDGTPMADRAMVEATLKSPIFLGVYKLIFGAHNVDRDIAPGSTFVKGLDKNPLCKKHLNITTVMESVRDCRSFPDLFLLALDRAMGLNGDGIVPLKSQSLNEKDGKLYTSHLNSLKIGLNMVDEMIF